jgi:orotate phosphoribosyltransferase
VTLQPNNQNPDPQASDRRSFTGKGGITMQTEQLHGLIRKVDEAGLLSEGHFAFRSGKHALRLLDRDRLLSDTHLSARMGYALSRHFFLHRVDVVAAPSVWGAGLAQWVGYFFDPSRPVIYSRPDGESFLFSDAASQAVDGKRVLVIDNLIQSGKTVQDFAGAIATHGGTPIGIGALADLSSIDFSVPSYGLLNDSLDLHDPSSCPACRSGEPVTQVGY